MSTQVRAVTGRNRPFGYVERFRATFEQHREGAAPALFGEVRIVNPPPPPFLTIQLTLSEKGTVDRFGTVTVELDTAVHLGRSRH